MQTRTPDLYCVFTRDASRLAQIARVSEDDARRCVCLAHRIEADPLRVRVITGRDWAVLLWVCAFIPRWVASSDVQSAYHYPGGMQSIAAYRVTPKNASGAPVDDSSLRHARRALGA